MDCSGCLVERVCVLYRGSQRFERNQSRSSETGGRITFRDWSVHKNFTQLVMAAMRYLVRAVVVCTCIAGAIGCGSTAGDGWCDAKWNTDACGWDGGDCCQDTCVGNACGRTVFACADPGSDFDRTCNGSTAVLADIGNGHCETYAAYNTFACNWDGGDCCISTCDSGAGPDVVCSTYFRCQDPRFEDGVGTGSCAVANACSTGESTTAGWDEEDFCACDSGCTRYGDCCTDYFANCNSTTVAPTTEPPSLCLADIPTRVGDGFCDAAYNTADCGYDGGDCCADTCAVEGVCGASDSSIFACVDPLSNNTDTCQGTVGGLARLGDGDCIGWDYGGFNTAVCGWDGGDCCINSCNSTDGVCSQALFDCRSPEYARGVGSGSCQPTADVDSPCTTGFSSTTYGTSEEFCACDVDCGTIGDCCVDYNFYCGADAPPFATSTVPRPTTAQSLSPTTPVGSVAPSTAIGSVSTAPCEALQPSHVGDGFCDADSNTASCGWDGGDCCADTCVSDTDDCDRTIYACIDPSASTSQTCTNDVGSHLGDGQCDMFTSYNTAVCNWDGGDCCTNTCRLNNGGGACSTNFDCLDPDNQAGGTGSCAAAGACASGESSSLGEGAADFCTCGPDCA